ncbi:MAG: FAD binding domain-containing protein [Syntrophobacterales bacterium]|jgi:4-hydroxybenzoyl-CoA reductase subunit beta|nr:FAD binding domain-containing protein [Syntrophobacterales bacterium]
MRLPYFYYREPITIEEAFSIMEEHHGGARVLAGGTDLIPLMKYGLETPSIIVSLRNLTDFKGIEAGDKEVFVGAMTSLADLSSSSVIRSNFPALHEAVGSVGAPPLRNVATVGGNIRQNSRCLYYNQSKTWRLEKPPCRKAGGDVCHAVPKGKKCFSVYCGDLAPALIALGGSVVVKAKNRERIIPLWDIFTGDGLTPFALAGDELIAGVTLPIPGKESGSSYVKMRVRPAVDYPLVSAAASVALDGEGRITKTDLVLGAAGPKPVVVEAGQFLAGKTIDTVSFDALNELLHKGTQMANNLVLSGSYRRKMLPVVAGKAIRAAIRSITGKENA